LTLRFGDIVIVDALLDPKGQNPKNRPAVIVTPSAELAEGRPIFVIAITTTLPEPLPNDYIPLPWSRPRHPRTGLNERNAAVGHWLAHVEESRIIRVIGRTPAAQLNMIVAALERLESTEGETP
jgi:mRNA-degrading endonuclease toxin of MazEF toxin-antitoxin module